MTAGTGAGAHAWRRALAKVMKLADGYYREGEPDNLMELAEGMETAPGIGKAMDGLAEAVMDGLDADDAEAVQRAYCVLSAAPFIALREHLIIPGMSEGRCRTMVFLRGMGLYSTAYTRLSDADVITGRGIEPGGGVLYDGPDISLRFVRDVDAMLAEDGLDRMAVPGFNPVAFPIDLMAFMADGGGADSGLADRAAGLMRESIFSNGPMWAPLPMDEETLRASAKPLPGAEKGSPAWRMLMDLGDNMPDVGPTAADMRFLVNEGDFTRDKGESDETMKDKAISLAGGFLDSIDHSTAKGAIPCHLFPQSLTTWTLSSHDARLLKALPEAWMMLSRFERLYYDAERTAQARLQDSDSTREDLVGIYTGSVRGLLPDLSGRNGAVPDNVLKGRIAGLIESGWVDVGDGRGVLVRTA